MIYVGSKILFLINIVPFKDDETCNTLYESYPGGPMCYCTHDDGCFHHHFHVQPEISIGEHNGLQESKHQAVHDSDYFIEVTATNKARLKTTRIIKVSMITKFIIYLLLIRL